ncbi:MAG: hypothetical protein ACOX52_20360 [Verrucomicrobiota bacterium]|jgi:hypothetical protein
MKTIITAIGHDGRRLQPIFSFAMVNEMARPDPTAKESTPPGRSYEHNQVPSPSLQPVFDSADHHLQAGPFHVWPPDIQQAGEIFQGRKEGRGKRNEISPGDGMHLSL